MTPALFLATLLHLAPALWLAVYTGLDASWDAVTEWHRTRTSCHFGTD